MLTPWEGAACGRCPPTSALLSEAELAALQDYGQSDAKRELSLNTTSLCSSFSLYSLRSWIQTCKVPSLTPYRLW